MAFLVIPVRTQPLTRPMIRDLLCGLFQLGDASSLCCFQCHGAFTIRWQVREHPSSTPLHTVTKCRGAASPKHNAITSIYRKPMVTIFMWQEELDYPDLYLLLPEVLSLVYSDNKASCNWESSKIPLMSLCSALGETVPRIRCPHPRNMVLLAMIDWSNVERYTRPEQTWEYWMHLKVQRSGE